LFAFCAEYLANRLVLVDYERMKALPYPAADVDALETKINTLVGLPKSQSNIYSTSSLSARTR